MAGIWVFAESRDQTLELLNAGRELADKLSSRLAAFAADNNLLKSINCGATRFFCFPHCPKTSRSNLTSRCLPMRPGMKTPMSYLSERVRGGRK
jgi:hypothetical protein